MNKKLILLTISLISGCASNNQVSTLEIGNGGINSKNAIYSQAPARNFVSPLNSELAPPVLKNYRQSTKQTPSYSILNTGLDQSQTFSLNPALSISAAMDTGGAGNPSRYTLQGESYTVLPFSKGFVERGIASWYGPDFHGKKTSNGEIYDMYAMTAAHKRLPIPSWVKVTNLKNNRSVVLRINDRGPYYADRVIDLSYAAAQKLDLHQPGTEMVQIEAVDTGIQESVYLQLGMFSSMENARKLQEKITANQMPQPLLKQEMRNGKLFYKVQLGPLYSSDKVEELNAKLARIGVAETWYVTNNKLN